MTSEANTAPEQESDLGTKAATAGGILGALAMTSCCILPLVLFSLGATGAWIGQLGALYQYKWLFFAFAGASLAYGFWKVYRPIPQTCADGSCERPLNRRFMKGALWTATLVVALSLAFPYIAPPLLGY
ncbi:MULTISPECIES: mercuric transporter MerT family protein [Mameliella]|uniref:mercuric transporter MerT family protein n=1 Tax=Mameliella TaxID=1434019 RepID=UPI000B537107|nr:MULTISPECIES: mercuric transporter MerT family protein [Mameliella]OWV40268.1 mercury transporter [Mameliella alba]OWV58820.1 mercury transporter [Mameliella alba]